MQASVLGSGAMVMPSGSEHHGLTSVTTVGALTDADIWAGSPSTVPPAPLQLGMLWPLRGAASCEHEGTGVGCVPSPGEAALG